MWRLSCPPTRTWPPGPPRPTPAATPRATPSWRPRTPWGSGRPSLTPTPPLADFTLMSSMWVSGILLFVQITNEFCHNHNQKHWLIFCQGLMSQVLWILPTFIGKIPEPDERLDSEEDISFLHNDLDGLDPADDRLIQLKVILVTIWFVQNLDPRRESVDCAAREELEQADEAAGGLRQHRNQLPQCESQVVMLSAIVFSTRCYIYIYVLVFWEVDVLVTGDQRSVAVV